MFISVINHKGGTGKTTTSVNLAAALADFGYRVLLLDLDSQASASVSVGISWKDLSPSIIDILFNGKKIEEVIRPSNISDLDVVTAEMELASTDLILASFPGRENRLKDCTAGVREEYDFILCDCPPSLSMLSVNALVASDGFIVPVTPEYLALEGLISLMNAVGKMKRGLGIRPELLGILFTMVSQDFESDRNIIELVREHYGESVFETEIPRDAELSMAPSMGKIVFETAPESTGAERYDILACEVIDRRSGLGKEVQ